MRNPLWILNIGIAFLFILTLGIMYFTRKQLPTRKSLTPAAVVLSPKKGISAIDLSRIYENDLFKTYQRPIKRPEVEGDVDLTFPQPPMMKPAPRLLPPQVQFLDPLKINLKGIISVGDEKDNRVIIEDEKTRKEELYAVGDTIEDSEILRIDSSKVIFIRSNGQEETVFLNAQDAAADPIFSHDEPWSMVVRKVSNTTYTVDAVALKQRVTSPAEFIELLDLTTAVKNDTALGCRVGLMGKDSIGHSLGLLYGDIIVSINELPVAMTKDRVTVYQSLKKSVPGTKVRVKILRREQPLELLYVLKSIDTIERAQPVQPANEQKNRRAFGLASQPIPNTFAEMQKLDKTAMRQMGGRSAFLQRTS
jgi:type II secretion system protein C